MIFGKVFREECRNGMLELLFHKQVARVVQEKGRKAGEEKIQAKGLS